MKNLDLNFENIGKLIFEFENYSSSIPIWQDLGKWNTINLTFTSNNFNNEIETIKGILIKFLVERKINPNVCHDYINDLFLKKLCYNLGEGKNLIDCILLSNGWKGRLGLEVAKYKLSEFKEIQGKIPKQTDFELISNKIIFKKKYWKEYGIISWNTLLEDTFGEVNKTYNFYTGRKGLDKATPLLIDFYNNNKRIPVSRDKDVSVIVNCIGRGIWNEFGIQTWNDLLISTFHRTNKFSNLYTGENGLNNAKKELTNFYQNFNRIPRSTDLGMEGMKKAIGRNYWKSFGINCWNDLIFFVFGKVNKIQFKWQGKKGLDLAIETLRNFERNNGRIPTKREKGMGGIEKACRKDYWKEFKINSWNELKEYVFTSNLNRVENDDRTNL